MNSPAYESPSNGVGERGVQSHEGQCRTIKLALEDRFQHRIPVEHASIPWLVRHAAHLLCLFHVGSDGRTALERLMGKRYSGDLVEFGAGIHFRHPHDSKTSRGGEMSERWSDAIWLGKRKSSDEHICALMDGTIDYTYSIRVREDKWNLEKFNCIKGVPWNLSGAEKEPIIIPESIPFTQKEMEEATDDSIDHGAIPRNFQITDDLIEKFGFSIGCRRCTAMQVGDPEVKSKRHSNECRARLLEKMKK